MHRRNFLSASLASMAVLPAVAAQPAEDVKLRHRGYYTIGTRYPTAGFAVWKQILDCMSEDGCNLLIHWIAGGFQSKKFPETWAHNKEHENIKADFTKAMIDYAHGKGIRVLLGFMPFGYDGVNLHTMVNPELKAIGKDGKPTGEFGIGCWGHSLCPAQPKSQDFMLEYVRELAFDFYPNADGLFIESSDYSTCHCEKCKVNGGAGHFENEFVFVKTISAEVWGKNPNAMIVVYPHYFSGDETKNNDGKAKAAKMPFDDRWTLFFTPHSTKLNAALMKKAKDNIWWDEAMIFGTPESVKNGAAHSVSQGFSGYIPTLEAYSFLPTHNEGEPWTKGKRQVPFGIGWVAPDKSAYDELPIRTARIAYREFSQNPGMSMVDFKKRLGKEVFGDAVTEQRITDLLLLQQYVRHERDWAFPSPVLEPLRVKWFAESGQLKPERKADLRKAVENLRAIAKRYANGKGADADLAKAARWIADRWKGENGKLLGLEDEK